MRSTRQSLDRWDGLITGIILLIVLAIVFTGCAPAPGQGPQPVVAQEAPKDSHFVELDLEKPIAGADGAAAWLLKYKPTGECFMIFFAPSGGWTTSSPAKCPADSKTNPFEVK